MIMKMKSILTYLLTFLISIPSLAASTRADSLYSVQHFKEASSEYELMLAEGVNDEIFYNLGNCYYRMGEMPRAILNYQKALKVNPQHADAQANLMLCLKQAGVQVGTTDELFYTTWMKSIVGSKSADQWGNFAVLFFAIFLVLGMIYLLSKTPLVKKWMFFAALFSLLTWVVLNVFAYISKERFYSVEHLVAMKQVLLYESATEVSKQIGEVPAGTILKFDEAFNDEWVHVVLPDGREAWCQKAQVEYVKI